MVSSRGCNSDEISDFLEYLEDGATIQNNIIQELLLLAHVRNSGTLDLRALDMNGIVRAALRRVEPLRNRVGATVDVPEHFPRALGCGPWIEEVWINYLTNAFKYGGESPHVVCSSAILDGAVRYTVSDDGPGIGTEERHALFVEFSRVTSYRAEGHGLGLSVVKRIIDRCGGEVGVESAPGSGAAFYFTLPVPD